MAVQRQCGGAAVREPGTCRPRHADLGRAADRARAYPAHGGRAGARPDRGGGGLFHRAAARSGRQSDRAGERRADVSGIERGRTVLRWLLAAIYLAAGVLHIETPHAFLTIVPGWVPLPGVGVFATGLCESAGGAGRLRTRCRGLAAVMLALFAACVFPANIKHAIDGLAYGRNFLGWVYHGPRLLFQPVIM